MKVSRVRATAYLAAIGLWAFIGVTSAQADGLIGPILPYTGFSDSPFSTMSFSSFTLVKMSDLPIGFVGPSLVPGVNVASGGDGQIFGPSSITDSVDGHGGGGNSLFSDFGSPGFTFTFDAGVLGSLPTAAGIVWTDGLFDIHFSATDANGNLIGQINDHSNCDFSCGDGDAAFARGTNYRFFGVTDHLGIKSISISNDFGGIELDHLQFGVLAPQSAVPEPGTLILLGTGLVAVAGRLKRKLLVNRS